MNQVTPTKIKVARPVRANASMYRDIPIAVGSTAFILPCHNEEADLPAALESIKRQEKATVDTILVVSDNSTDATVAIARDAGVSVIETSGNLYKKAGALNAGIRHLMESGTLPEFIITGDGDTEYDARFAHNSLNTMKASPRLGVLSAVCYGKTGLVSVPKFRLPKRPSRLAAQKVSMSRAIQLLCIFLIALGQWAKELLDYVLIWMQRAEYTRAVATRLRQNIHTMSGAGSVLRAQALVDVLYMNLPPGEDINWQTAQVYRENSANLVEDFALTLDVKKAGWKCTNNYYVVAHTDLMRDFSSLMRQRIRWVRGTVDELRRRNFSRESRLSALTMILGLALIPLLYAVNTLFLSIIVSRDFNILDFWILPLMGIYQAIMVRKMGWKSMFVAFLLLPEMLFGMMRHAWIIISVSKSYLSTSHNWE